MVEIVSNMYTSQGVAMVNIILDNGNETLKLPALILDTLSFILVDRQLMVN